MESRIRLLLQATDCVRANFTDFHTQLARCRETHLISCNPPPWTLILEKMVLCPRYGATYHTVQIPSIEESTYLKNLLLLFPAGHEHFHRLCFQPISIVYWHPSPHSVRLSLKTSKVCRMCYQRFKTRARFPDCTGGSGPCSTYDPEHDHIQPCRAAETRGRNCNNPSVISQASSTRRNVNCPKHRDKKKKNPQQPPERDAEGGGGPGGLNSQTHRIRVGA